MLNHNVQNPALYTAAMSVLRERFGALAVEEFIADVRGNAFDYTEWRKTQPWYTDMTVEEYLDHSAETTKDYQPPKGVEVI
ncbi:hypothetical protein FACS189475_00430 [Betaproteobacteria bacterium]|nr:hypothetical protein FACS189475_00430 [Betaproteobacteria bacterium]